MRVVVKCIIDTTFSDFYIRTFNQVVVHFEKGRPIKSCYRVLGKDTADMCSHWGLPSRENGISPFSLRLREHWTGEEVDGKMRWFTGSEIFHMKRMQKKYDNY